MRRYEIVMYSIAAVSAALSFVISLIEPATVIPLAGTIWSGAAFCLLIDILIRDAKVSSIKKERDALAADLKKTQEKVASLLADVDDLAEKRKADLAKKDEKPDLSKMTFAEACKQSAGGL